jgi:hypothetical protein
VVGRAPLRCRFGQFPGRRGDGSVTLRWGIKEEMTMLHFQSTGGEVEAEVERGVVA